MLAVIVAIQNDGDRRKAEKIFDEYYGTMFHIARSILHENHLSEDAVSEAFIKIIKHLEKINVEDCYRTRGLIVIIVRHTAIDMLRRQNKNPTIPLDEHIEYSQGEELYVEDEWLDNITIQEAREEIAAAIGKLNERYSDILYLKMAMTYSNDEIASILEISKENAKMRLCRARKALKEMLRKEGSLYGEYK